MEHSPAFVEQIIRPTGLLDPEVDVRPIKGQIDDLIGEIRLRVAQDERVLVTTLTKRMSEELTNYLKQLDMKVRYLHSDITALERMEILRELRLGEIDVIVGINLLREGLDLPEVSLVAILDADKEGFLRSESSLIQTIGRAARNAHGKVIMYADKITRSMKIAIDETNRRRRIQNEYNEKNGIIPQTIRKQIYDVPEANMYAEKEAVYGVKTGEISSEELQKLIKGFEEEMFKAAKDLDFERAAELRDAIIELKGESSKGRFKNTSGSKGSKTKHAAPSFGHKGRRRK
jgi:excinuclease ABC subunit B